MNSHLDKLTPWIDIDALRQAIPVVWQHAIEEGLDMRVRVRRTIIERASSYCGPLTLFITILRGGHVREYLVHWTMELPGSGDWGGMNHRQGLVGEPIELRAGVDAYATQAQAQHALRASLFGVRDVLSDVERLIEGPQETPL